MFFLFTVSKTQNPVAEPCEGTRNILNSNSAQLSYSDCRQENVDILNLIGIWLKEPQIEAVTSDKRKHFF